MSPKFVRTARKKPRKPTKNIFDDTSEIQNRNFLKAEQNWKLQHHGSL